MLETFLASALFACAALASETHAPVPGSPLWVTARWPGFVRDAALERVAAAQFGAERVVLAGGLEAEATTLSVLAETSRTRRTSAQWREQSVEAGATLFQTGAVACSVQRLSIAGGHVADDFHAWVVAAGVCLDLHATSAASAGEPELTRKEFEKLVEAFVVSFPRRGTAANLPPEVRALMHGAMGEPASWSRWLDETKRRTRDVAALEFTRGELCVLFQTPREQVIAAHTASLAAFAELRTPNAPQRFAWMVAEESLGLAQFEAGRVDEAYAALGRAHAIACQLKAADLPAITYNLARAACAAKEPADALRKLDDAIAADPAFRAIAARDKAFAALANDKRFVALVRP